MTFKDAKVVITGGSMGIGKQLAVDLLGRGAQVMVCARSADTLAELKEAHPAILTQVCDVQDEADVDALYAAAADAFGKVDLLINNAAIIQLLDLMDEDMPVDTWLKEMEVNVQGTLRVTHRFLPMLKEARTATIVNFTSGLAYVPIADAPFYSASKAALASWTKSLRYQLRHTKVSVVEVSPPVVDTRMNVDNPSSEGRKKWSTEAFCKVILDRLAQGRTDILVGDGAGAKTMSRLAPGFIFRMMNPPKGRAGAR